MSRAAKAEDRRILSDLGRRTTSGRTVLGVSNGFLMLWAIVTGLLPLVWLGKAATSTTQDTIARPMDWWPSGFTTAPLGNAWVEANISHYFINTVIMALGVWVVQLVVAATGAYGLVVLRPRYAGLLRGLVLGTLFLPSVVLLVPLYLTAIDIPIVHVTLLNSWWGVWLPAGANAFNILLVMNFLEGIPRELYEAARIDGANSWNLFWRVVMPMAKPILSVVSIFAIMGAWKDFLWPMLILSDPEKQPLSVRLPSLAKNVPVETLMAGMLITTIIPVVIFLLFQRAFLNGAGNSGALKG